MSSQLVWELVKNNHAFLRKGLQKEQFTSEPGNLYNKNSYKYSGLANSKTVDITPGEGLTVKFTKSRPKTANKPASAKKTVELRKRFRRQLAAVGKEVGYIRPDLKDAALRRLSAVHRSQVKKAASS